MPPTPLDVRVDVLPSRCPGIRWAGPRWLPPGGVPPPSRTLTGW